MTFGVFMHKDGSIYDDIPEVHYQSPKSYLSRAKQMVGDWIVYREPVKLPQSKGFFAVAKVERIVPDPEIEDRYRALIEEGSYLPFEPTVPHIVDGQPVERDLANAQAAVRPLSNSDFARIIALVCQMTTRCRALVTLKCSTVCKTRKCLTRLNGPSFSPSSIVHFATAPFAEQSWERMTDAAL